MINGNWKRYRKKTRDKAFVVLKGHDSKAAGTYVINLFKNLILKSITMLPTKNQQLYSNERLGACVSMSSDLALISTTRNPLGVEVFAHAQGGAAVVRPSWRHNSFCLH